MIFRKKNTPDRGIVRYIIFREDDTWYGVALEFNLVVDAESKFDAYKKLDDAVKSYVNAVRISKLRNNVLNQDTSSEYSKLWKDLENGKTPQLKRYSEEEDKKEEIPIDVAAYGILPQFA